MMAAMSARKQAEPTGFLFAEEGESRVGLLAEVAPVLPGAALRGGGTYPFLVPDSMAAEVEPGRRVRVPIGRSGKRLADGFVIDVSRRTWESTIRPIDSVVDDHTFLTPPLMQLGRWIADYYCCPLGRTLAAMTPESVRAGAGLTRVRYVQALITLEQLEASSQRVTAGRRAVMEALVESPAQREPMGAEPAEPTAAQAATGAEPAESTVEQAATGAKPAGSTAAQAATGAVPAVPLATLCQRANVTAGIVRDMARKGWVKIIERRTLPVAQAEDVTGGPLGAVEPDFELTADQAGVLNDLYQRIDARRFSTTLLFGVSGSGKTEVYVRALRHAIARGGQAILLVPEIMLTTQLVQRLACRFSRVAILHSGLTGVRRSLTWRRIAAGELDVVIGTRSAVFAPCPDLRLICVDEEQETGYKNLQAPRFHVRDVAVMRASQAGIAIVLGSATPALETWYNAAVAGRYHRLDLYGRVHARPMPRVSVVDMRTEAWARRQDAVLSRLLQARLQETFGRGEQAVILINRRGYATRIFCPACRMNLTCPNCSVSLVVHVVHSVARCHYCRMVIPLPDRCPNVTCRQPVMRAGTGTQRVEEAIAALLPQARIRRVDRDTMHHRDEYAGVIRAFEQRSLDILVGTQMVAKGLDFPAVSLVGVIHAEGLSASADFRFSEHLFQLLTQVAGRAGRSDIPGEVVIQSSMPDSPAVRLAAQHDYTTFAAAELHARRSIGYPPFARLVRFVVADEKDAAALAAADQIARRLKELLAAHELAAAHVTGPAPCALPRLRKKYRYDVLLRAASAADVAALRHDPAFAEATKVKVQSVQIDVDPVALT
ncbi:MAG: primosomal protein N' [Phycisphaerales bacterium]|nr:MAG: primosomal protein N' [Phycisphaerales bacterium]